MIKFVVVHRKDANNVGDMASNPLQYFLKPDEYLTIDITELKKENYPSGVPVIVGGGGLIGNDFIGDAMRDILGSADKLKLKELWNLRWKTSNPVNNKINEEFTEKYQELISEYINKIINDSAPRFAWGVGHNGMWEKKSKGKFAYPDWLIEYDLVGIRDWGQDFPWVPCASCMHPALTKKYSIKNDIIWFEHKKQLIKDFGSDSIPRFINSGNNIEQAIELIGSTNTVITNSYHGAYWGLLMNKKVIIVNPWSNKFFSFRHKPSIIDKDQSWKDVIEITETYPDALSECVNETEKFWNKIKQRL